MIVAAVVHMSRLSAGEGFQPKAVMRQRIAKACWSIAWSLRITTTP
jgi:hypothetical protein